MSLLTTHFHFLRPEWLTLIVPAIVLVILAIRAHSRSREWQSIIAPHLLPYLMDGKLSQRSRGVFIILLLLWTLLTLALAGPAWEKLPQPLHRETSALVIAWDLSPSMMAEDVKPSRLVRSRLKLIELLRQRKEGLTALIAYSGEAHIVTPLTDDTETIVSLLSGLDPAIMPAKGSNTEMALELAQQLLADGGIAKGDIVFLTDGIARSAQAELRQLHDDTQHTISIWGIGTPEGAPIPLASGGFAYDRQGDMVIARLNDRELSDVAVELNGLYIPFTQTEFDLRTIQNFVFKAESDETRETSRLFDQWYEHGPYLLLILLPFAALAFRRGWLLSFGFIALVLPAEQANAVEPNNLWDDLWLTQDQQAQALLPSDPAAAADQFNHPQWQGIAHYNANNFEQALEAFAGDTSEDLYNRGNALTQLGKFDEAIEHYQQSLELDPSNAYAINNKTIAEALKKLAEEQAGQESQPGDGDQNEGDQDQQQNPNESDSNQQQGEAGGESDSNEGDEQQANNEPQGDQQSGEHSDSSEQTPGENTQALSDEQEEALEQQYGQQDDQTAENEERPEQESEASTANNTPEQQDSAESITPPDASDDDSATEDAPAAMSLAQMAEQKAQQEAQQSLEQWLRKVPDDPSGLLRNKFQYENSQRKRSVRQNSMLFPNQTKEEERW
ncbi:VWA domain-containing protein [Teredinibacter purpureus]|uniref:VWA domain-containing protein n=1 Tax=Teredinibacter purpureus TaxID=2731756 RepID=UPI0005F79C2F|nr:VWA domain-containing protein [Teredinibacter purpureus]